MKKFFQLGTVFSIMILLRIYGYSDCEWLSDEKKGDVLVGSRGTFWKELLRTGQEEDS